MMNNQRITATRLQASLMRKIWKRLAFSQCLYFKLKGTQLQVP